MLENDRKTWESVPRLQKSETKLTILKQMKRKQASSRIACKLSLLQIRTHEFGRFLVQNEVLQYISIWNRVKYSNWLMFFFVVHTISNAKSGEIYGHLFANTHKMNGKRLHSENALRAYIHRRRSSLINVIFSYRLLLDSPRKRNFPILWFTVSLSIHFQTSY